MPSFFSQPAQMSGRDIEERSDIFERKEGEDVGVSADKFIVPLLWILDIQVDIAVIDGGIDLLSGVHYDVAEFRVAIHTFLHFLRRYAINLAIGRGYNSQFRFLAVQTKWPVCHKTIAEHQSHHVLGAVGRTRHIFKSARLYKSDIAANLADRDKFLSLGKMPQRALADANLAPSLEINIVDICIKVLLHILHASAEYKITTNIYNYLQISLNFDGNNFLLYSIARKSKKFN